MKINSFIACLLAAIATLAVGASSASSAEPVKIRTGWINVPSGLVPVIFKKDGIARHLGRSYTLESTRFIASTTALTALANGELDIAVLGFPAVGFAIENAGMEDLRIVADETPDGVKDHYSVQFFVRNDGPTKPNELKGKVLATNGQGSTVDIAMRLMMRKHGLEYPRDYTIIEAPLPTQKGLLLDKKADLIISLPPFCYDPELLKNARPLFTQKDSLGISELAVWAAKADVLKTKRAALVDFFEDYLRGLQWYADPTNRQEAIRIISDFTKVPAANFESWLFTEKDFYREPTAKPDLAALQRNIDATAELGFLKKKIDIRKYTDLTLMDDALKRLKQ